VRTECGADVIRSSADIGDSDVPSDFYVNVLESFSRRENQSTCLFEYECSESDESLADAGRRIKDTEPVGCISSVEDRFGLSRTEGREACSGEAEG
jgi:hypothetical protein